MEIKLNEEQARKAVSYLGSLTKKVQQMHDEAYSGVDKLLYNSAIMDIEELSAVIAQQIEAQEAPSLETEILEIPEA
jgi:hypothetical protein